MESTVLKDFQKEIEKMNEDDVRLKTIRELEKYRERKDLGIRNYPESCMERMLSDDQVHGI
tara:strand:+ start:241 stop:423 length:183 start_codon:yes stop_codon:yes gene_type:complete